MRLAIASGTNITVLSAGKSLYPMTAEYTTNLFGTPTWLAALTNTVWINGTNTTTFGVPANVNPAFIRVRQAAGP